MKALILTLFFASTASAFADFCCGTVTTDRHQVRRIGGSCNAFLDADHARLRDGACSCVEGTFEEQSFPDPSRGATARVVETHIVAIDNVKPCS